MHKNKLIIMLMMLALLLASCSGKENNMGVIEDVEIENQELETEPPLFEKQPSPFKDYTYQKVEMYAAKMSFELPVTWKVYPHNANAFKISVPYDDPHFAGNTFYVQCLYDFITEDGQLDEDKSDAKYLYRPFAAYIEGLSYSVGGSTEGCLRRWRGGWDTSVVPSFVSDDKLAYTVTAEDEVLYNKKTASLIETDTAFNAVFYKWQNFPVMISSFSYNDQAEDAVKMLEFIMSTSRYLPQKVGTVIQASFGKHTFSLPQDFAQGQGTAFHAPNSGAYSTGGMGLSIYEVNKDALDAEVYADEDILDMYGERIAFDLVDPGCRDEYYLSSMSLDGEPEKKEAGIDRIIYASCNIVTDEENHVVANYPYGSASCYLVNIYVREVSGKCIMCAVMFAPPQTNLASTIGKLSIRSVK